MKREIKFRVFDKISKQMYRWSQIASISLVDFEKEHYELMQFTGLKDKNDIDIYDGDIVKWGMYRHSEEHFHRYATVEINPDIKFKIIFYIDSNTNERKVTDNYKFNYGSFAYKDTESHLEVIGNIYENTELLCPQQKVNQ